MPTSIKRILVPVDFHASSRAALTLAAQLATPLGASMTVLHVVDLPTGTTFAAESYLPVPEDYRLALARHVTEQLNEWIAGIGAAAVATDVEEGDPATEVVRYAKENEIDLIVMGTHGHAARAQGSAGSVAEKVVRTAHCPVVTVRE